MFIFFVSNICDSSLPSCDTCKFDLNASEIVMRFWLHGKQILFYFCKCHRAMYLASILLNTYLVKPAHPKKNKKKNCLLKSTSERELSPQQSKASSPQKVYISCHLRDILSPANLTQYPRPLERTNVGYFSQIHGPKVSGTGPKA